MAIRAKTKQRLMIFLAALLVLGAVLGGGVAVQKWRLNRRALAFRQMGLDAFQRGDYPVAMDRLGRYILRFGDKGDVEAWYRYAQAERHVDQPNGKNLRDAADHLRRGVLARQPDHEGALRQLLEIYTALGMNTEAVATADELLKRQPGDAVTLCAKGDALLRLNRPEDALKASQAALDADPESLRAHMLFMTVQRQLNTPAAEMIARADALRGAHPDHPQYEMLTGYACLLNNQREDATKWFRAAAGRPAPDASFAVTLVNLFDRPEVNLFEDALPVLEKAAQSLKDPLLEMKLVRRYLESGRSQAAADRLASLDPADPKSDSNLLALRAMALLQTGHGPEAAPVLDALAARTTEPDAQAWVLYLRDVLAADRRDPRQTIQTCRKVLERMSSNPYVWLTLGDAYADQDETQMAMEAWRKATWFAPPWPEPYLRIARGMLATGRPEAAVENATLAIRRAPRSAVAQLVWVQANAAVPGNASPEAAASQLTLVDELRRVAPRNEDAMLLQAALRRRAGQPDAARAVLEEALKLDPPPSEAALLKLAALSQEAGFGLEDRLFARARQGTGLTPSLAYAQAESVYKAGRPAEGVRLLDEGAKAAAAGQEVGWQTARARYLELIQDPQAAPAWAQLAAANPKNADVQQMVLRSPAVWNDLGLVDATIARLRELSGEDTLSLRIAAARRQLRAAELATSPAEVTKNAASAATALSKITEGAPNLVEPHELLARCHERLNEPSRAAAEMAAAAELRPDVTRLRLEAARLEMLVPNPAGAQTQLDKFQKASPTDPAELRQASTLLVQLGEGAKAAEMLEQVNKLGGGDRRSKLLLAEMYGKTHRDADAEKLVGELLQQPDTESIMFAAGFYGARNRPADAQRALALLDKVQVSPAKRELILGNHEGRWGKKDEALRHFERAAQLDAKDPAAWLSLIRFCIRSGMPDRALDATGRAAEALPDHPAIKALARHREDLRANPPYPGTWALALAVIEEPPHLEVASKALDVLASLKPGQALSEDALRSLRGLAESAPRFLALQTITADMLLRAHRNDEAAALAMQNVRAFPASPEAARSAAEMLAAMGRWKEVIPAAEQWRDRAGDDPGGSQAAHLMLAQAYNKTKDPDATIREIENNLGGLLNDPEANSGVVATYAGALLAAGQETKAEALLSPLLAKSALWRAQWVKFSLGLAKPESSAAWLDQAARFVPQTKAGGEEQVGLALAWDTLAKKSGDPGHERKARDLAASAAKRGELSTASWATLGSLQDGWGDAEAAEQAYQQSLAAEPNNPAAQNNLAYFLAKHERDLPGALKLAQGAVNANPKAPVFLDTLAFVQAKSKRIDDAVKTVKQAIDLEGNNPRWHLTLAEIYADAGQADQAKAALQPLAGTFDASNSSAVSPQLRERYQTLQTRLFQ